MNYNGYAYGNHMHAFGHVFENKLPVLPADGATIFTNLFYLFRCFNVKPAAGVTVLLQKGSQNLSEETEDDGFFSFQWQDVSSLTPGWHEYSTGIQSAGTGSTAKVFVPYATQFAFISDIDDTILISHAASPVKKLWQLLTKRPSQRKLFEDVNRHYKMLATAGTSEGIPNPFFYVSSSEWNLYDYLQEVFRLHKLPEGIFLLNQVKQLHQLFKTGTGKHEGKLLRIVRIFEALPTQQFVLIGDNAQQDPYIYQTLSKKYPERIYAIYIRNVNNAKAAGTRSILNELGSKNIHTCFFTHSSEAIEHSKKNGLMDTLSI
ncbi:MAG: phosphatase domain-containing protein [Ferruginibacter sp.]